MTVQADITLIAYTADGVATVFAYTFRVDRTQDFEVYVDDVLQTYTTHYTADGLGQDSGGNITFVAAPANNSRVTIARVADIDQSVDYTAYDPFPAETHEVALDRLAMICQQLDTRAGRSLEYPKYVTPLDDNLLPEWEAGKYLAWHATERRIINST